MVPPGKIINAFAKEIDPMFLSEFKIIGSYSNYETLNTNKITCFELYCIELNSMEPFFSVRTYEVLRVSIQ